MLSRWGWRIARVMGDRRERGALRLGLGDVNSLRSRLWRPSAFAGHRRGPGVAWRAIRGDGHFRRMVTAN